MTARNAMLMQDTRVTKPDSANRRHLYAQGAALLEENCHVVGAEALFDQALTNGLLAIAADHLPDHRAVDVTRSQPSASVLLILLGERAGVADGVAQIPTGRPAYDLDERGELRTLENEEFVPLYVVILLDAIRRTQAPRHGRGPGEQVTPEDVHALVALDSHPALDTLHDHYLDQHWRRAHVADRTELARAADYLDLIDEEEVKRRAEQTAPAPAPGDVNTEPQDCPVCDRQRLQSTGGDDFGYGITAGTCLVCSYRRSDRVAYDLGVDLEWERRWESQ